MQNELSMDDYSISSPYNYAAHLSRELPKIQPVITIENNKIITINRKIK